VFQDELPGGFGHDGGVDALDLASHEDAQLRRADVGAFPTLTG